MNGAWSSRLGMAVAFVAPAVSVQLAALFMSPPRMAGGTPPPASGAAVPVGSRPIELTDAERAAAAHVVSLRVAPLVRSPMDSRADDAAVPPPVESKVTRLIPLPSVRLQLIWASGGGDIAVIDGTRYREGDSLEGVPWVVREIDSVARSVLIEDVEGKQTLRLSIDKPPQPSTQAPRSRRR